MAEGLKGRTGIGGLHKLSEGVRANTDLTKTGAGLTRGANQGKKLNNAAWTNTFPAQGATLDLDFANNRGFVRGVGQGKSMDAVTFTRAASGNFVKPDGTLSSHSNQGALGKNLLTFPQDFDNAAWVTSSRVTIVANQAIAPNGTNTADLMTEVAVNGTHRVEQSTGQSLANTYTLTCYYKIANGSPFGLLFLIDQNATSIARAWFDLANGTLGGTNVVGSAVVVSSSITDAGNGWYRCTLTGSASGGVGTLYATVAMADANLSSSYVGNTDRSVFIWGAQLEVGSSATEYFPTNINTPRFDWASTTQLPQNILLRTEDFANTVSWVQVSSGTVSVTSNSTAAPDGATTADTLTGSATNIPQIAQVVNSLTSQIYTFSFYAKADTNQNLTPFNGPTGLGTAALTTSWQRFSFTFTSVVGNNQIGFRLTNNQVVYVWGAQLETGSTATTYIANGAYVSTNTPLAANSTSNGLLIEEARTNRILWCRDATQTNWTKTNVTAAKDQTGIDGVANAASSLTSTSANGTCIQTITLASGSRTGSVFLKRITGTGTIQVTLDGTTYSTVELSASEWRRIVLSGTVTNPTVGIKIVTSGDAVAMDYGQVEDGLFATSPILTTTATVTRSADSASVQGSNFLTCIFRDGGTIQATAKGNGSVTQLLHRICGIDNTATAAQLGAFFTNGGYTIFGSPALVVSEARINSLFPTLTVGQTVNVAFSFGHGLLNGGGNGIYGNSIPQYDFTNVFSNVNLTNNMVFAIGSRNATSLFLNGTISRVLYTPKIQTLSGLQDITSGAT